MQTGLRLSELTGLPRQDVALGIASGGVIVAKNGRFENHRTTSLKRPVRAAWSLGRRFDLVFHAEAFAFDDDGVGVMEDSVEDGAVMPAS